MGCSRATLPSRRKWVHSYTLWQLKHRWKIFRHMWWCKLRGPQNLSGLGVNYKSAYFCRELNPGIPCHSSCSEPVATGHSGSLILGSSSSSSSISTTAHCGLWPVYQHPATSSHLSPALSISSLLALEDPFLPLLSISSWVFPFVSAPPILD